MEWAGAEDDTGGWEPEGDEKCFGRERSIYKWHESSRDEAGAPQVCDGVPLVEELVTERGHMCLFIPRFHCELNPIKRCWCHVKKYIRAHSNSSIIRLWRIIPEGLASVAPEMIARFFRTCGDYEKAYREGNTCTRVDEVVKEYKSYRRVS